MQCRRKLILEQIALTWNLAEIQYGVVHGLEAYPVQIGRDLDVLLEREDMDRCMSLALKVLKEHGWKPTIHRQPWAIWIIAYYFDKDGIHALEIDLFSTLQWGFVLLADSVTEFEDCELKGPFRIDPWGSFVKRILIQILGNNFNRFLSRKDELKISKDELKLISEKLPEYFGNTLSSNLLRALKTNGVMELKKEIFSFRKKMHQRALYNKPTKLIIGSYYWARNELALNVITKPVMPVIALVGPDGVGKSTILRELKNQYLDTKSVCSRVDMRHWRPGLLPQLGQLFKKQSAEEQDKNNQPVPPRRDPGRFTLFRSLYYSLDFILGYWLIDRPSTAKFHIVLYDRHALDMYVDPVRYGIDKMPKWLLKVIRKPDFLILLSDAPELIRKRKAELSTQEISRQLSTWESLYQQGKVDDIIRVDGPSEQIAARVMDSVIRATVA